MTKKMLIDASHAEETRVVVLDGSRLEDFDVETATRKQIKGNIYLAKVIRVEPSLQAAFVEYGGNRHGFLAFGEIHPDYYQIPVADRQRLLAQQAADAAAEAAAEEAQADQVLEHLADEIDPEPELLEVSREPDPAAETPEETHATSAQALEITPIGIIQAPPPEGEEAEHFHQEATGHSDEAAAEIASEDNVDGSVTENGEEISEAPPPENLGGEGDDAAEERERRQRQRFLRNYKIQEVIHRRQIMLIQVVKEERGNKGAALTTYLSLAGRFSVLMPNSPTGGGVSRKITSVADRRRLKEAMNELDVPSGMGLIVRTAGANRPKPEIKRDCEYLLRLWDDIRDRTMQSTAPALIYEEASLIKRAIRDVYTRDVDDVFVDGEDGYRAARDFMRMLMPSHAKKVQLWSEGQPLFAKYQVEAQLDAMLNPIVQLRSGGYIVINQTEALVAIDVNSGRSTRERNIEDTAVRTNMEAAEEAARQLRMRDLAGLIVIDFIDMESRKNNAMVERKMKDALKNDRARIQVGSISHFGLMELSRQRLRPSLAEASLVLCPHCAGMGQVRSPESAALHILRAIEDEGAKFRAAEIVVFLPPDIALYLFNHKRDRLTAIEARYAMRVIFTGDSSLTAANFRIEKTKAQSAPLPAPAPVFASFTQPSASQPDSAEADDEADETEEAATAQASITGETAGESSEEGERRRRRRRRRGKRRGEPGSASPQLESTESGDAEGELSPPADAADEPTEIDLVLAAELADQPEASNAEEAAKPPRRRRTRGGRSRSGSASPEGFSEPALEVPVYADIADIFEAAERAEAEARRVKAQLAAPPEPQRDIEPVPEAGINAEPEFAEASQTASHLVFEPEPPRTPDPLVKPTVIGAEGPPAEKKRGWWRR